MQFLFALITNIKIMNFEELTPFLFMLITLRPAHLSPNLQVKRAAKVIAIWWNKSLAIHYQTIPKRDLNVI